MGIWKINIERNYCVIAYAMPTHSVHSPIPFKGIPEPPLEVVCLHASFLDGFRLRLKTGIYAKNPSSNGYDAGRFPAGYRQHVDAMGNEPQERFCPLA